MPISGSVVGSVAGGWLRWPVARFGGSWPDRWLVAGSVARGVILFLILALILLPFLILILIPIPILNRIADRSWFVLCVTIETRKKLVRNYLKKAGFYSYDAAAADAENPVMH